MLVVGSAAGERGGVASGSGAAWRSPVRSEAGLGRIDRGYRGRSSSNTGGGCPGRPVALRGRGGWRGAGEQTRRGKRAGHALTRVRRILSAHTGDFASCGADSHRKYRANPPRTLTPSTGASTRPSARTPGPPPRLSGRAPSARPPRAPPCPPRQRDVARGHVLLEVGDRGRPGDEQDPVVAVPAARRARSATASRRAWPRRAAIAGSAASRAGPPVNAEPSGKNGHEGDLALAAAARATARASRSRML